MPRVCGPARTFSLIFLAGPTRQRHDRLPRFKSNCHRPAAPRARAPRLRPHRRRRPHPLRTTSYTRATAAPRAPTPLLRTP
jgi:hypothetical protein